MYWASPVVLLFPCKLLFITMMNQKFLSELVRLMRTTRLADGFRQTYKYFLNEQIYIAVWSSRCCIVKCCGMVSYHIYDVNNRSQFFFLVVLLLNYVCEASCTFFLGILQLLKMPPSLYLLYIFFSCPIFSHLLMGSPCSWHLRNLSIFRCILF